MSRPAAVLAAFAASLAVSILLLVFFEPDVQTVGATELYERRDDARAFLAGDFVFIALYAVVSPIAIWRFGRPRRSRLALAAALLLVLAGVVDVVEGVLLLSATGGVSEGTVDAAHALAIPKVGLFLAGLLPAIVVNVQAARELRGHQTSPSRQSQVSSAEGSSSTPTGST